MFNQVIFIISLVLSVTLLSSPETAFAQQTEVGEGKIQEALAQSARLNRAVMVTQGDSAAIVDATGNSDSLVNRIGLEFGAGFSGHRDNETGGMEFQPRVHVRLYDDQIFVYTGYAFGGASGDQGRYGARFVLASGNKETTSESDFWLGVELSPGKPKEAHRKNLQSAFLVGTNMGKVTNSTTRVRGIFEAGIEKYETSVLHPRQWNGRAMGGIVIYLKRN